MFNFNNITDFFNSTKRKIKNTYFYYFAMPDQSDIEYNLRTGRGYPRGIIIVKLYSCGNFLRYQFSFAGMRANYNWMKSTYNLGSQKVGGGVNFLYEKTSTFLNYHFSVVGMRAKYSWIKSKSTWIKSKYNLGSKKIGGGFNFLYEKYRTKILGLKPVKVLTFEEVVAKGQQLPQPPVMTYDPEVLPLKRLENIKKPHEISAQLLTLPQTKPKPDNGYISITDTSNISYNAFLNSINESTEFLNKNNESLTKNKTLFSTKKLKGKPELDLLNKILKQSQQRIDKLKIYRGIAAANLQAKINCIENDDDNSELYKKFSKVMEPIGPTADSINGNPVKNEYITFLNKKFRFLEKEAKYSGQLFKTVPKLLENFAVLKAVSDPKLITGLEKHSKSLNPLQGGLAHLLLQKRAINSREWFNSVYQAYKIETKNPNLTEDEFSEIFNKVCHHKIDTEDILPNLIKLRNTKFRQASEEIKTSYRTIDHVVTKLAQNSNSLTHLIEKQNIGNDIIDVMEHNEDVQLAFNSDFKIEPLFLEDDAIYDIKNDPCVVAHSLKIQYLLESKFSLIDTKLQMDIQDLNLDQDDLIEYARNTHGQQDYFYLPERDNYPSLVSLPDDDVITPTVSSQDIITNYQRAKNYIKTEHFPDVFYTRKNISFQGNMPYYCPETKLITSSTAASTDANNAYIEKVVPFDEALLERMQRDFPSRKIQSLADLPSPEEGYKLIEETSGIPWFSTVTYEQYAYYQNYLEVSKGRPNNMIIIPESRKEIRPRQFELDEIDEENISSSTDSNENIRFAARQINYYIDENERLGEDWAGSQEYQLEMTTLTKYPAYVASFLNIAYKNMESENPELAELATQLARIDTEDLVSQLPYKQVENSLRFLNHTSYFPQIKKNLETYLEYYYPTKIPGIGGVCDTVVYHDFKYPYPRGIEQCNINQLIEKGILTDFAHYKNNCKTKLLCDIFLPLEYLENARFNTYKEITVDQDGNVNRPVIFKTRDERLQPVIDYSQHLLSEIQELSEKNFNIEEMHNARETYMSKFCLNQVVEKLPSILLSEINPTQLDQQTFDLSDAIDAHNLDPSNHVQIPEFGFRRLSSSYEELTPSVFSSSSSRDETSEITTDVSRRVSPQTLPTHNSPFMEIERIRLFNDNLITIANNEFRFDKPDYPVVQTIEHKVSDTILDLLKNLEVLIRNREAIIPLVNYDVDPTVASILAARNIEYKNILDNLKTYLLDEFRPNLQNELQQKFNSELIKILDNKFFVTRTYLFNKLVFELLEEVELVSKNLSDSRSFKEYVVAFIKTKLNEINTYEADFIQHRIQAMRRDIITFAYAPQTDLKNLGLELSNCHKAWIEQTHIECESIDLKPINPTPKTESAESAENIASIQQQLFTQINTLYGDLNVRVSDLKTRYTMENLTHPSNTNYQRLVNAPLSTILRVKESSEASFLYAYEQYSLAVKAFSPNTSVSLEVPFMPEHPGLLEMFNHIHRSWLIFATIDMVHILRQNKSFEHFINEYKTAMGIHAQKKVLDWLSQYKDYLDSKFLEKLMATQPLNLRLPWFKIFYDYVITREAQNSNQERLFLFKEKLKFQSELSQTKANSTPEVSISDTKTEVRINSPETQSKGEESTVILLPETVTVDDLKKAGTEGKSLKTIFDTLDPENRYPLPSDPQWNPSVAKSQDTLKHSTESVVKPDLTEKQDYALTPAEKLTAYLLAQDYIIPLPMISKTVDPRIINANLFRPDLILGVLDKKLKSIYITDKKKQKELPNKIIYLLDDRWNSLIRAEKADAMETITQLTKDSIETKKDLLNIKAQLRDLNSKISELEQQKAGTDDAIVDVQKNILVTKKEVEAKAQFIDTEAGAAEYYEGAENVQLLHDMHDSFLIDRKEITVNLAKLSREQRILEKGMQGIFREYCGQVFDGYEVAFLCFNDIVGNYSKWCSTFREENAQLAAKLTELQAKQQSLTNHLKICNDAENNPTITPEGKAHILETRAKVQQKYDSITSEYLKLLSKREEDYCEHAELAYHLALLEVWPLMNPYNEWNVANMVPDNTDPQLKEVFTIYEEKFNSYIKKFPDTFRRISKPDYDDLANYALYAEPANTTSLWSRSEVDTKFATNDNSQEETVEGLDPNETNELLIKTYSLSMEIFDREITFVNAILWRFNIESHLRDILEEVQTKNYSSLVNKILSPFVAPVSVLSEDGKNQLGAFIKKFNIESDPTIISQVTDIIFKIKKLREFSNEHCWDLTKVFSCNENMEQHLDAYLYGEEKQLLIDYLEYIDHGETTLKTGLYHKQYLLPQNLQFIPIQDRLEFLKYNFGYNPLSASVLFNPILNKVPIKILNALKLGKTVRMSPAPGCISYSHLRYFLELQTNLLRPEVFLKLLDFDLFSLTAPDTVTPPMAYGAVLRKMTQSIAESPLRSYVLGHYPIVQQRLNDYFTQIIKNPSWGQEDSYRILFNILNTRKVDPIIKVKILNRLLGEPHLHFSVQLQILAAYRKFLLTELPELYADCSDQSVILNHNFYKQLQSQLIYKNKSALITVDNFLEKTYLNQPTQVITVKPEEQLYRVYFSQFTPNRDTFFVNKHMQLYPNLHIYLLKCHEKINQLSNLIIIPVRNLARDTSNISYLIIHFLKQSYASQPSLLSHFNLIEKFKIFITDIRRGFNDSQTRSNSQNDIIPETTLNLTTPVTVNQKDLNLPKSDSNSLEPINEIPNPFKKSQLDFSEKDAIPYITIESYKILPRPNRRIDPFPFRGRKGKVIDYLNFRIKLLDLKKLINNLTNGDNTMIRPLLETPGSILNLKLLKISIFMKDLGEFLGIDVSFLDANPTSNMCIAEKLDIPLLKLKIPELPDAEQLTETKIYDLLFRQNLAPQVKPHLIKYNEILVYNRFNDFLGSQLKICRDNFLLSEYIKIEDKSPYLDLPLAQLAAHVIIRVNDGLIYTFRFLGLKDNLTQITIFTDKSYLSFIHFIRTENNLVNKKGLYLIPNTVSSLIEGFIQLPSYTNKFNLFVTNKPKSKYQKISKASFVRNKSKCYFIKEYKLNSFYKTNHDVYLITGDKKPIQVFTNLSSYNEFLNPALRSLLQVDFGYIKIADMHPGSGLNSKFVSNINYKINVDKSLSMSPKIGFLVTFQNATNKNISALFADPFKQFSDFSSTYGFFIRQKFRQSLYQYFKLTELWSNKVIIKQTFLQKDQNFLTQFIQLPYWFNYQWLDDQMKLIAQWVYAYRQRELVLKINRQLYKTLKSYNILGTIYAAPSQKINPLIPVNFKERFRYFMLQKYTSYPPQISDFEDFFDHLNRRLPPGCARLNISRIHLKKQFEYAVLKLDSGVLDKAQNLIVEKEILDLLTPKKPIILPTFAKFKKTAKKNLIREFDNFTIKVEEAIISFLGNPLVSKLSQTSSYLKTMVFKLINSFQQLCLKLYDLNFPFVSETSKFSLYSSGQEIFKFMLSIYNVVDLKVFDLDSRLFSNILLILLPIYRLVVKKIGNQLVQGNFSLKKCINKLNVNKEKFSFDTVDYGYKSRLPYWNDHYATSLVQYFWSKSNQSKIKPLLCSTPNETVTFSNGLVLPLSQVYKHAAILQLQQCGNKYATFFNIRAIKFQLTELMFFLFKSIEKLIGSGLNLNLPNLNYIARIAILDSKNFNGGMILWHIQHNSLYCELFTPTSRTRKKIKLNRLSQAIPSRHVDKVYHCGTKIRYDTDIQSHGDTKQIIFRFKNTNHLTIGQFTKFDKFKEIDDLYEILKKDKLNLADTLKKVKLFEFTNPNVTQFMTKRKKQKMEYLIYMAYPNVSGIKVKTPVKSIFDNGLDWKIPKIQGTHIPTLLRPATHIRSTIGDFVEPNDQVEPLKIPSSEQKDKKLMDSQTKEVILSLKGKGIMAQVYETISDFIKSELFSWITFQEFRDELLRQQNDITPYGIMSQCISALTQGLLSGFMLFAADFRRAPNTKKSARLLSCKVIIFSGLITVGAFCLIHYGGVDLLAELFKLSKWFLGRQRIPQPVIKPIQLNTTLDDYDTSVFSTPYYAVRKSNWGIIETVGNVIEASKKMLKVVRDIDIDNLEF